MSFAKSVSTYHDLENLLKVGANKREGWNQTPEYERLFKLVWNEGKTFYARCVKGKLPSQRDFDLFYQEGIFGELLFCYKGKDLTRENTSGHHLKCRMTETLGFPYPLCKEDLEIIVEKINLARFWLPAKASLCMMEYKTSNGHFREALGGYASFCPVAKSPNGVKKFLPNILVVHGSRNMPRDIDLVGGSLKIVILTEITHDDIPTRFGEILSIAPRVHLIVPRRHERHPTWNMDFSVLIGDASKAALAEEISSLGRFLENAFQMQSSWYETAIHSIHVVKGLQEHLDRCEEKGGLAYHTLANVLCKMDPRKTNHHLVNAVCKSEDLPLELRDLFRGFLSRENAHEIKFL